MIDVIEREDYTIIDFDAETEQWTACTYADDWWKGYLLYTEGYYSCFPCEVPAELVDYINYDQNWVAATTEGRAEIIVENNTYLVHR